MASPVVPSSFSVPAPAVCADAAPTLPFSRRQLAAEPASFAAAQPSSRRLSFSAALPPAAGCGSVPMPKLALAAPVFAGTPPRTHAGAESDIPDVLAPSAAHHLR